MATKVKRGRPTKFGEPSKTINVTFSPGTFAAMDRYIQSLEHHPHGIRSDIVEKAVSQYLAAKGFR